MNRWVARVLLTICLLAAFLSAYILFPWPIPAAQSFELIAHRGVHQTFPLTNLKNDTCTAAIIDPPRHDYLENTIPSMQTAFAAGATAVELDIHRTSDNQLAVFHDWTLDCRTNGSGEVNAQPMAALRELDIAYGYTPDGGKSYPLRGSGVGLMKTLPEILAAFPDKHFIIHDKDGDPATAALLAAFLQPLSPAQRALLSYWGSDEGLKIVRTQAPEVTPYIYDAQSLRSCQGDYLLRMLLTGSLPARCQQQVIGIPYRMLATLPGWPNLILARAHQAGARVYITDVDSAAELETLASLPIDGIQTNRIEEIGPLLTNRVAPD